MLTYCELTGFILKNIPQNIISFIDWSGRPALLMLVRPSGSLHTRILGDIDIFQKIINKNFVKILLKSIQKSLADHEFINVPCNISGNLSLINYEKSTLFTYLNLNKKINKT